MKISQKILLYMLPLVILPLLLLGGFAYISSVNNNEQQAQSRLLSYLDQQKQQVQNYYQNIELTHGVLSQSHFIEQFLSAATVAEQQQAKRLLINVFSQLVSFYPDIYEVRLLGPSGLEVVRFATEFADNLTEDESQTGYFRQIKRMTDEHHILFANNPDNQEVGLISTRKIFSRTHVNQPQPQLWGYLVLTIRPSVIINAVNGHLGHSGNTFITDDHGTILFAPYSYLQGTQLANSQFEQMKSTIDNQTMVTISDDNGAMNYQGVQLFNGYLLFTAIARSELKSEREYIGIASIGSTIVVILVVPFLLYFFLKTLVLTPIAALTRAKQLVGAGHLDVRLEGQSNDEIGQLYQSFNQVVSQLQGYRSRETEHTLHLEDKILVRTKALRETNQTLSSSNIELKAARLLAEQANELKSSFLANMSHEIRTPLTAIIGFTEQSLKPDIAAEEQHDYLQRVLRSGQHLLHLINEILDLSKIEADKLELEHKAINLFELLTDIDALNTSLAREKGLHFAIIYEYPLPNMFKGDLIRLRQILLNLCGNAVKFTRTGDVILTVNFSDVNNELLFSIQDSGIGLTDQELKRLFQPFVQADASITRQFGGSGLGLVISQKLTQLMKGRIEVESIKGLGSRFDVYIPVGMALVDLVTSKPFSIATNASQDALVHDFGNARVLVAEDNTDNQYLIELLLQRFGVDFETVDDGKKAVEAALSQDFDLILMDIQMPEMGGCEAVELLRSSGIDCPIIALTANIMKEDIDGYLQSGFDGTLAKPIQQSRFYETINRYLKENSEQCSSMDKLIVELENDHEVLQLKANFKAGLPQLVVNFNLYLSTEDWHGLKVHAHMVKGSAGSLGYPLLTEQAGEVESFVKTEQYGLAKKATKKFIQTCEQFAE